MKIEVAGGSPPNIDLLASTKKWMQSVRMTGEVILAVSKTTLFVIGKDSDPYKWICFWNPTTHSINGGTGIVRFYDWDAIPSRMREGIRETFSLWKAQRQFND